MSRPPCGKSLPFWRFISSQWYHLSRFASPLFGHGPLCRCPRPGWRAWRTGNEITLTDTRGSKRCWRVADVTRDGVCAEASKTAYVTTVTALHRRESKRDSDDDLASVGNLPQREGEILLKEGDTLILTRDMNPGRAATSDSAGVILTPPHIGCTIPEVFDDVKAGESIWFDDGKIGGVIERVEPTVLHLRITRTRLRGEKLRSDKGINFPDSALRCPH